MTKIVCISDTHNRHKKIQVPDGDILICAGDITNRGELDSVKSFNKWIGKLPHKHKITIAGNHDFCFQDTPKKARSLLTNCIYLEDESTTVEGLKIWGSPYSAWFCNWAFNLHRGKPLQEKWAEIDNDTVILVTHGPPFGILDRTADGRIVGDEDLLDRINSLNNLKIHVFGHIHEGFGVRQSYRNEPIYINASVLNERYVPTNYPITIDL